MNTKNTIRYIYVLAIMMIFPVLCKADSEKDSVIIYVNKADSLYNRQNFNKALDYYIKGMKHAQKAEDMTSYMACIGYIANIYTYFGDRFSGLSFLKKGYETALKTNHQNMQSCFLSNLVSTSCKMDDLKSARKYLELLKNTPTTVELDGWRYFVLYSEARVLTAEHKFKEAMLKHEETLKFARDKKIGVQLEMYQENEIALLYVMIKDYENALLWGQKCLDKAVAENQPELIINAYKVISDAYGGLGEEDKSAKYYTLYSTKRDSLYNVEEFYSVKYELSKYYDKKAKEDYNMLKKKSFVTISTIVVVAIVAILIILAYKKKKTRRKRSGKTDKSGDITETVSIEESQIDLIYERIKKVMEDKHTIFNPDFSLNMLCDMVESNKTYVSWIINNKYNKNFSALLNEKRIAEACVMLDDDEKYKNYTIQSVYEELGYTNASSFIRQFKKIMNVTPVEYRNRNRE